MFSTCPNCLNQVQIPAGADKITCECGSVIYSDDFSEEITAQPSSAPPSFQEAENVFEEVRDFGEKLNALKKEPEAKHQTQSDVRKSEDILFTYSSGFESYRIEKRFSLFSMISEWDKTSKNPLERPLNDFLTGVKEMGAGGCIELKIQVSSDFSKVLIFAIPVNLSKK